MPAIVKEKKEKVAFVVASSTDAVEFSITAILEFCSGNVHCNLHSHPFLFWKIIHKPIWLGWCFCCKGQTQLHNPETLKIIMKEDHHSPSNYPSKCVSISWGNLQNSIISFLKESLSTCRERIAASWGFSRGYHGRAVFLQLLHGLHETTSSNTVFR